MSKISNLKAYYNENMSWMWNFIMAESGAIFTFGKSRFGDNLPNKFWVRGDKAKSVACGDEHTALVTGKCVSIDTFIRGNFISRFTWDELVCVDHFFHDQALSTPFFKFQLPVYGKEWFDASNTWQWGSWEPRKTRSRKSVFCQILTHIVSHRSVCQ